MVSAALLLAAAVVRAQAPEPAEDPLPTLSLDPGATCLERDRLVARVVRWREQSDIDANSSLRVEVRGDARDPTRIFFFVELRGAEHTERTERVIEQAPSDCDQLHSAVALSIALALDASLSAAHRHANILEDPPPQPAPAPSRSPEQPKQYTLDLALFGGASIGVVPSMTWAVTPRLQFGLAPWLAIAIEGMTTQAKGLEVTGATGKFDVELWALGLDACVGGKATEALSVFSCVGLRRGTFTTHGQGFEPLGNDTDVPSPWWAVAAAGHVRLWVVPTFGLGLAVEALVPLAPRDIVVTMGTDVLHHRKVSGIGFAITAGPVFRFF